MLQKISSLISPLSLILAGVFWLFSAKNLGEDNKEKIEQMEKDIRSIREKTEVLNERLSRIEGKIDTLIRR
jgi:chaperonin cofactor prefoldin